MLKHGQGTPDNDDRYTKSISFTNSEYKNHHLENKGKINIINIGGEGGGNEFCNINVTC